MGKPTKENEHVSYLTDPHKWYRHPLLRMIVLWLVIFMDFFTYGEDPSQDSWVLGTSAGLGQIFGPLAFWYAPDPRHMVEKVLTFFGAVLFSKVFGRLLRKYFFVRLLGLHSFRSDGGNLTSCIIMFVPGAFLAVYAYNYTVPHDPADEKYIVDAHSLEFFKFFFMLRSLRVFELGKMWQSISSTLDWLSIWQITDSIFQDTKYWPRFMPGFKKWYTETWGGKLRKIIYNGGLPSCIAVTVWAMHETGHGEGKISWEFESIGGTNEVSRSFCAAFIIFLDFSTLIQDWEFPLFSEEHHAEEDRAKIAGTDKTGYDIYCPSIFNWARTIRISAKWMQYGPLLVAILADLVFVKSQFAYSPASFGQYVDKEYNVWSIHDTELLDKVYPFGTNRDPTLLQQILFPARQIACANGCNDVKSISRFINSGGDQAGAVCGICVVIAFLCITKKAHNTAIREHVQAWGQEYKDDYDVWKHKTLFQEGLLEDKSANFFV